MAKSLALSNRNKMSEDLAVLIAETLANGTLAVGAELPSEVELAEHYEVSRPVAREAVQQLAFAGMLQVQHGKRTTVRAEREWNVLTPTVQVALERADRGEDLRRQLYEVRYVLESACAGFAAARATGDELASIARIISETNAQAEHPESIEEFLRHDREFHEAIALASDNLALRQLTREVHGYLSSSWEESLLKVTDVAEAAAQHAAIGAAVAAADSAAARRAMEAHIRWAGDIENVVPAAPTESTPA